MVIRDRNTHRVEGLVDLRPLNLIRDLSHLNCMTFDGLMIFRRSPHGLKPRPHLVRSYLVWESRPLAECELREERVWRNGGYGQVVIAILILSRVTVTQGTNGHK
jgi:hypothetical protein